MSWESMIDWEIRTKGFDMTPANRAVKLTDEGRAEMVMMRRELRARLERLDRSRIQVIRRLKALNEILPSDGD